MYVVLKLNCILNTHSSKQKVTNENQFKQIKRIFIIFLSYVESYYRNGTFSNLYILL
jgi:hypothetical protein